MNLSGPTFYSNDQTLPAGIELGTYTIVKVLGRNLSTITYLARDKRQNCDVVLCESMPINFATRSSSSLALKPLNGPECPETCKWAMEKFIERARLLSTIHHPNIVEIRHAFSALGTYYIVMPYLPGSQLHQSAPAPQQLSENWLRPILKSLLWALAHLHSQGMLHYNIKPDNILLERNGTPHLISFGCPRILVGDNTASIGSHTTYIPTEQLMQNGKQGPWTDLYSLGATCYKLITGDHVPRCIDRIGSGDPYVPLVTRPELRKRYSNDFLAGIDKALSVWPKHRWQSAEEWLGTLLDNQPLHDPLAAFGKRPSFMARLSKACLRLIIAAGLTATAVGAWHHIRQNSQQEDSAPAATPVNSPQEEPAPLPPIPVELDLLITSARRGEPDGLRAALAEGADVNATDNNGDTALGQAAYYGHIDCVRLLLDVPGIDVNKKNSAGSTPLRAAKINGHAECAQLIQARGGRL